MCEAAAWLGRDVRRRAWQAFDERSLELSVCLHVKEAKSVCRWRGCLWASESETGVHEVTTHQLFDFPSFPGKQLEEQCRETTNRRQ